MKTVKMFVRFARICKAHGFECRLDNTLLDNYTEKAPIIIQKVYIDVEIAWSVQAVIIYNL